MFELRRFETEEGKVPFTEWLEDLDYATRRRVRAYLDRMATGNFGDSRSVGKGVLELKIHFGPGYRVYYTLDRMTLVVLLRGGTKGSQEADIHLAHKYAEEYRRP